MTLDLLICIETRTCMLKSRLVAAFFVLKMYALVKNH